jgi:hypothetical protein
MFILNNTDVVILIFRFSVASTTGLMAVTKLTPAAEDDTIQELLASFRANPAGLQPLKEPTAQANAENPGLDAPAKRLHAQLQANLSQSDRDVVDLLAQCAESQFTQFTQLSQATQASQHTMDAPFSAPREAPPNKASSLNFTFLHQPSAAQPPAAVNPQDKAAPPSTGVRTTTAPDNAASQPLISSGDASPHEKCDPSPEAWSGLSGQLLPALSQIEGDDHAWQDVEADPAWEQQARLLSPSSLASQNLSRTHAGKRKVGGQQASRDPVVDEEQHLQETQLPLVARRKTRPPACASASARATATSRDVAPRPKREKRSPSTMGIALGSDAQYKQLQGLSDSQLEEHMCCLAASPFAPDAGRRLLRFTQLYTERFESDTF